MRSLNRSKVSVRRGREGPWISAADIFMLLTLFLLGNAVIHQQRLLDAIDVEFLLEGGGRVNTGVDELPRARWAATGQRCEVELTLPHRPEPVSFRVPCTPPNLRDAADQSGSRFDLRRLETQARDLEQPGERHARILLPCDGPGTANERLRDCAKLQFTLIATGFTPLLGTEVVQ